MEMSLEASIKKNRHKKLKILLHFFFSFTSHIWPKLEYCCHIWAGAVLAHSSTPESISLSAMLYLYKSLNWPKWSIAAIFGLELHNLHSSALIGVQNCLYGLYSVTSFSHMQHCQPMARTHHDTSTVLNCPHFLCIPT